MSRWQDVTRTHVLKAVRWFEENPREYPAPRNTFLCLHGKQYPAKHIRGIAYTLATGHSISKEAFAGGNETARFFRRLGFTVQYSPKTRRERTDRVIGRIVLACDPAPRCTNTRLLTMFDRVAANCGNAHVTFLITPGGFLRFAWPKQLADWVDENRQEEALRVLTTTAERTIKAFMSALPRSTVRNLRKLAAYLTIGIDSDNEVNGQHVELVAILDLRHMNIVHWTGKSHPVNWQAHTLIRVRDLTSHFCRLGRHRIIILGCHDLNLFSPRSEANAQGWKLTNIREFWRLAKSFRPDVILQHPHTTDTPNIWNLSWKTVEKRLQSVKHYASGIRYVNRQQQERSDLTTVLTRTRKGSVVDFVMK